MPELGQLFPGWLANSAGLPTLQWSLLLATAALAGELIQRFAALPRIVGYALVGFAAGLLGFSGAVWPLGGVGQFLIELGLAIVLFEAGGRVSLRWFRHNPMVLLQSLAEAALTFSAVYLALRWIGVSSGVAAAAGVIGIAASPAVLLPLVTDLKASGPVTERAIVLASLNTLYALSLGTALVGWVQYAPVSVFDALGSISRVFGLSVVVAGVIALTMRMALRWMNPASENTAILLLALIALGAASAGQLGGNAPLAALLAGMLLKQIHPGAWLWPGRLGSAASVLVMLMLVLVAAVSAEIDWSLGALLAGVLLVGTRVLAKGAAIIATHWGSGARITQSLWVAAALCPMSATALLLTSALSTSSPDFGRAVAAITLPAIVLMEIAGALVATWALRLANEAPRPLRRPDAAGGSAP